MSYHIKATPYFQRILATSKQSGELERLKEEYDRIKCFNEKVVDAGLRKVRLQRLYQEIDQLRVANLKRRRLNEYPVPPKFNYAHEKRRQNLTRAKEIGQYYSRRNAIKKDSKEQASNYNMEFHRSLAYVPSKRRIHAIQQEESQRVKENMTRRSNYGNEVSNLNMKKMITKQIQQMGKGKKGSSKQKLNLKPSTSKEQQTAFIVGEKMCMSKERLMHRITYGNTISDLNKILIPKHKLRTNVNKKDVDKNKTTSENNKTESANVKTPSEHKTRTQKEDKQDDKSKMQTLPPNPVMSKTPAPEGEKAEKKLPALQAEIKTSPPMPTTCEEDRRYQLRSISNDTNLPNSAIIPENYDEYVLSENEDEFSDNDLLIKSEYYSTFSPSVATLVQELPPHNETAMPPIQDQQIRRKLKPIPKDPRAPIIDEHNINIKRVIKLYEPISTQVVPKKLYDTSVQGLLAIFEHKN